jgi:exosortase F-associated protein
MKKITKVIGIGLAVIGFVCIRLYQKELFYDPLILFYKSNFQNAPFPQLDFWRYNINLLFRYLLNTLLSLLIIWFWFEKKTYVVFSGFLYTLILLLGIIAFWIVEQDILPKNYMKLFYIRRFLIQPILVIILIPAFYFQKISKKG